jgi:hypothetical protein
MSNASKRATIFIGGFLVIVMALSTFAPMLMQGTNVPQQQIQPTDAPAPTLPPPITDFTDISFDQVYLHPTGLFTIGQPPGWTPGNAITEPNRAAITMNNPTALSVIEVSVEPSNVPLDDAEQLSARFDATYLDASWQRYRDWSETQRVVEDNQLVMDFNVSLNRQEYVARQQVWTDGDWIYSVRVVTPSNAVELLRYVLDNLVGTLTPLRADTSEQPFFWMSFYDPQFHHAIRYPGEWDVVDSAPGLPTSIIAPNGTTLRVEAKSGDKIDSEDAAIEWVKSSRAGVEVLSVAPVEQANAAGYSVAYAFSTVDGEAQSGLALLLNGADDTLHSANLRFPSASVDLNEQREALAAMLQPIEEASATEEAPAPPPPAALTMDSQLVGVVDSFAILPALNLAPDPNAPTPVPIPTVAPAVEVTEVADDATAEADATDSADEPEAEAEIEADAEATEESSD